MIAKIDLDQLSEREIAERMDRGLKRLVSMGPMPHKPTKKKRRAAHKKRKAKAGA